MSSTARAVQMKHYRYPREEPVEERIGRFLAKVEVVDECWLWTAHLNEDGYGQFWITERCRSRAAHRIAYELFVGPIPTGLTIDHTCHNKDLDCLSGPACQHRRCVNPAHLEPTTVRENIRRCPRVRKTECVHGHPYTPETTGYRNGWRFCRVCSRRQALEYYRKNREDARQNRAVRPHASFSSDKGDPSCEPREPPG